VAAGIWGGLTTGVNGLGECERCNYGKEAPGWTVRSTCDENGCHTAEFITPTGARHQSKAPRLPGLTVVDLSEIEVRIGVEIAKHAA
jgi:hypothetical protein